MTAAPIDPPQPDVEAMTRLFQQGSKVLSDYQSSAPPRPTSQWSPPLLGDRFDTEPEDDFATRAEARQRYEQKVADEVERLRVRQAAVEQIAQEDGLAREPRPRQRGAELDAMLARPDAEYDWLVPGLLERGDRLILTGQEGQGKSTLFRQLAVQLASGLHPFAEQRIEPVRVLLLDLENPAPLLMRKMRELRDIAGLAYQQGLHIEPCPEGLDLLDPTDATWMEQLVADTKPDIVFTGPAYKMANHDSGEEPAAKTVALYLDRLRTQYRLAIALEAHVPHASNGGARPERPFGPSLWKRWPEFGIFLSDDGMLRHWRGARDERDWPAAVQRGGDWPWTALTRPRDLLWARVVETCHQLGEKASERDLALALGATKSTIHRVIEEHLVEWLGMTFPQVRG